MGKGIEPVYLGEHRYRLCEDYGNASMHWPSRSRKLVKSSVPDYVPTPAWLPSEPVPPRQWCHVQHAERGHGDRPDPVLDKGVLV